MMPPEPVLNGTGPAPLISVIIACRNVGRYIDEALGSARRQSLGDIEILIIDDGSTDDTAERLAMHAASDTRVRLFTGQGSGPAAARNIGLANACGTWIAILDGDDIMHPRRFELLLAAPAAATADIIAENQIQFYEDGSDSRFLIEGDGWQRERRIDLTLYVNSNRMFGAGPQLGYLKPLIRRSRLSEADVRYDENLRIGEDYDLIARLLLTGANFLFLPAAYYFYRRHSASISFRLGAADTDTLIAAAERFQAKLGSTATALRASQARLASLIRARNFADLVNHLKAKRLPAAAGLLLRHPTLLPLLADAVNGGMTRRLKARQAAEGARSGPVSTNGDRRCAVLWRGDAAAATPLLDWLREQGWQTVLYLCEEALCALDAGTAQPQLPALVRQRTDRLLLCNDPRLVDCLTYLLAPAAKRGLVTASGGQAVPAGIDLRIDYGPGGLGQRDAATAQLRQLA